MSRRKAVVVTPQPAATVLRRSARLISEKNRELRTHVQQPGKDPVLVSDPASSPTEDEETSRKSRGDFGRKVSKRLAYSSGGFVAGANSRKSPGSNGSIDGLCTLRRSPRFSSRGNSNAETEKSTQRVSGKPSIISLDRMDSTVVSRKSVELKSSNVGSCTLRRSPRFSGGGGSTGLSSSDGGILGKSVLGRCNMKAVLSEGEKGEALAASSDRICTRRRSCILLKTKPILGACDRGKVSICPNEGKGGERRKPIACVNEPYQGEENAVSSSHRVIESLWPSSMSFDSGREFVGEKRPEIVSGLCATRMSLTCDRSTANSSRQPVVKADGDEGRRGELMNGRSEEAQLKMKSKLDGEGKCGVVQGWTKEQELALQRAYFTAKPSPHFWKKVSKLVPGKSAQECFDRVHSDLITPSQPLPRSRAKKTNLSPIPQFSLSASKLLKPIMPKTKISGHNKQRRNRLAQKTIRHLLEKQCHVVQAHELDLFSVLEHSTKSNIPSTPTEKGANNQTTRERSSSGHKRPCSRFVSTGTTTLASPPVLKQVRNKALHEKYIDQLHFREAKRKAESARVSGKENVKPIDVQNHSVRAAKDALIFDVKDAIEKLKSLQADNSSSSSDFCYDHDESEEEGEAIDV